MEDDMDNDQRSFVHTARRGSSERGVMGRAGRGDSRKRREVAGVGRRVKMEESLRKRPVS